MNSVGQSFRATHHWPTFVGLWRLNEGAGQTFADASGNARHGTLGTASGAGPSDPARCNISPAAIQKGACQRALTL